MVWAENPAQLEVRSPQSAVVSFRMPPDEFEALASAADEIGQTLSEYIREAIQFRIRGVTVTGATFVFAGAIVTSLASAWSETVRPETRVKSATGYVLTATS
jgi:hypothetical protein